MAVLRFSVSDTDKGIEPEYQEKLFAPYSQGAVEVARKYGGTGLGLTICRRLAELMDSQVEVASRVGEGSTFAFDVAVPIDTKTDPADLLDAAAVETATQSMLQAEAKPLKILQVEDNDTNRIVAERILNGAGHQVVNAADGVEALAALKIGEFGAILMDRHLPRMTGLEATRRIREMPEPLKSIPIIGITESAIRVELDACLEAGMDAVLTKPINARDLFVTLSQFTTDLKDSPVARNGRPILVVDDTEVNLVVAGKQLSKLNYAHELIEDSIRALDLAISGDYSAILLDIKMPVLDGFEFTKRLRKAEQEENRHTPIIAVTGFDEPENRTRILEAGMDDFLIKPVVAENLAATLHKWIPIGDAPTQAQFLPVGNGAVDEVEEAPVDLVLLGEILGEENEEELFEVLEMFSEKFPLVLTTLKTAVLGREREAVQNAAHAAKGAANLAAAVKLKTQLETLEEGALQSSWEDIDELAASIGVEFERVVAFSQNQRRTR